MLGAFQGGVNPGVLTTILNLQKGEADGLGRELDEGLKKSLLFFFISESIVRPAHGLPAPPRDLGAS